MQYELTQAGKTSPDAPSLPHLLKLVYGVLSKAPGPLSEQDVSAQLGGDHSNAFSVDNVQKALRQLRDLNYVDESSTEPAEETVAVLSATVTVASETVMVAGTAAESDDPCGDAIVRFLQRENRCVPKAQIVAKFANGKPPCYDDEGVLVALDRLTTDGDIRHCNQQRNCYTVGACPEPQT